MMTRSKRIYVDKELADELEGIKKKVMIDLNMDITSVDASKIFIKKVRQNNNQPIIIKGVGKKRKKINIL